MATSRSRLKGQILAPDFTASIALFSLFVLVLGLVWNTSVETFIDSGGISSVQHDYSFNLLSTEGYPEDWNRSNVQIPGIYDDGFLSAEKFLNFYDLSVTRQRKLLRVDGFYMRVHYLNGTTVKFNGRKLEAFSGPDFTGSRPVPANRTVYASRRLAVLEETGKRVELRYYTWTK